MGPAAHGWVPDDVGTTQVAAKPLPQYDSDMVSNTPLPRYDSGVVLTTHVHRGTASGMFQAMFAKNAANTWMTAGLAHCDSDGRAEAGVASASVSTERGTATVAPQPPSQARASPVPSPRLQKQVATAVFAEGGLYATFGRYTGGTQPAQPMSAPAWQPMEPTRWRHKKPSPPQSHRHHSDGMPAGHQEKPIMFARRIAANSC